MMFPQLAQFTDVALLLLRVIVGIVFFTSGWNDLKDPDARSKDIGMSKGFTIFLGAAEVAGSLGVIFGVLTQLAAAGVVFLMARGGPGERFLLWRKVLGGVPEKREGARQRRCWNESSGWSQPQRA